MKKTMKKVIAGFIAMALILGVMVSVAVGCGPNDESIPYETGVYQTDATDGGISNDGKYYTDYASISDTYRAGRELNIQLAKEGQVLLKNEKQTLPLKEKNISVFGFKAGALFNGTGSGSGGGSYSTSEGDDGTLGGALPKIGKKITLYQALELAGFNLNPKTRDFFDAHSKGELVGYKEAAMSSGEIYTENNPNLITNGIIASYGAYDDAAIYVISREGGEDNELARMGVDADTDGDGVGDKHELELTENEKAMIRHIKTYFKKVIVLLNTSNVIELGELQEEKTANNLGVDAILWIGGCGNDGALATGMLLNGTANPSGRLVDTYARDLTKDPTFFNVGDNAHLKDANGNPYDNYVYVGDKPAENGYHSIEYREDIYMGYRYYETVAADLGGEEGEKWYKEHVVYPFGYGLSYTTFDWELVDTAEKAYISAANTSVTVKVKVTNTGDVAGKDVVELYNTPPYTPGGIEKSAASLVQFAKTDLLQPGESQVLSITIAAQDLASFDWSDKNGNGFKGYELEAGEYILSLRKNSHDSVCSVTRIVEGDGILCKTDLSTGNEIKPLFGGEISGLEQYKSTNDALENNLMTRTDMQLPATSTIADRTYTAAELAPIDARIDSYYSYQDKATDPWYVSEVPSSWSQANSMKNGTAFYNPGDIGGGGSKNLEAFNKDKLEVGFMVGVKRTGELADKPTTMLDQMAGIPYTEPTKDANGKLVAATDEGTKAWDEFMNQLTYEEMAAIVGFGWFGGANIDSIDRLAYSSADGASQFASNTQKGQFKTNRGTFWVTAVVVASTWNQELCYEQGNLVGNESLFLGCNGWFAPSTDIHRSPFAGRNFEYYSEDGVLAGYIAANVVKGATEKGVVCYVKHFFMNDQETNRMDGCGLMTFATEQAMREIYAKPFELCVKVGGTLGFMSGYNTLGMETCSTNYAALECLLRQEWGFKGHVITDMLHNTQHRELNLLIRAGNDLALGDTTDISSCSYVTHAVDGYYKDGMVYVADQANAADVRAARDAIYQAKLDTWNGETGKSLITEEIAAKETTASPTQWYAVRKAAQRILFNNVNSNAQHNGYTGIFDAGELTATSNESTYSVEYDLADIFAEWNSNFTFVRSEVLASPSETTLDVSLDGTKMVVKKEGATLASGQYTVQLVIQSSDLGTNWATGMVTVNFTVA